MFEQLYHTISSTGQPDFIAWTGDNVEHSISKDPRVTTNATIQITQFIKDYSPESVVFPIHGNHEFDPMNIQDFNLKLNPVIELISEAWAHWLPEDVKEQYLKNTYFSFKASDYPNTTDEFKRKMKNTRIISLNTQNCYVYNFHLMDQFYDPGHQLEWLENLLREMEKTGEVAIIIGHMSPGTSDCANIISTRMRAIYDRFQHVIRLSLFGHTHMEEFEVIRSMTDKKPVGVNHISPSLTTFTNQNPSFRAITLDVVTKLPVKIETYTFDLQKANKDDSYAKFFFSHEFAVEYGLPDLSPASLFDLTQDFKSDEYLALKYKSNMFAHSPESTKTLKEGCDQACRNRLSCRTSNSSFRDVRTCYSLFEYDTDVFASYIFDIIYNEWVVPK